MAVTLSAVVLLGILTIAMVRSRSVTAGSAVVVFLFGFFVAGTGAHQPINALCQAIADALTHLIA
ncbi:hypothetical protein [Streptomyces sp. NPDC101393]|uniref:hypothetical protein n=1 Tax=Streptomyces sp. NPDC101393 TaxID=3366141 RepID=UPI003809FC55